jgi:hypothetical protein
VRIQVAITRRFNALSKCGSAAYATHHTHKCYRDSYELAVETLRSQFNDPELLVKEKSYAAIRQKDTSMRLPTATTLTYIEDDYDDDGNDNEIEYMRLRHPAFEVEQSAERVRRQAEPHSEHQ